MPTVNYKSERADYRYLEGIVGQYQGTDVCIVPKKDFSLQTSKENRDLIYAIADKKKKTLKLVMAGMIIGEMTSSGYITMYKRCSFFDDGPEKHVPIPEERSEASPQIFEGVDLSSASGIIDEFLAGETLVDRFLKELEF